MDLAESAATPLSHPMLRPAARSAPGATVVPSGSGSGSMESESLQANDADDWCMQDMRVPDVNDDAFGMLPPSGGSPTAQHTPAPETGLDNTHTEFDDLFSGAHTPPSACMHAPAA